MDTQVPPLSPEDRLATLEKKIDYLVEESRKVALSRKVIFWLTIFLFILPLIGMIVMLPSAIKTLQSETSLTSGLM